jgi:outer membrane protein assembly factor BamD (BamD/ComL family)
MMAAVVAAIFLSVNISLAVQPSSPPVGLSPEEVLGFAHHLFSQQDYLRAIGEYHRFLSLYPDHPEGMIASLRIVQCNFRTRQWEEVLEAVQAFNGNYPRSPMRWQARFLAVQALLELGRREEARQQLQAIIREHPGHSNVDKAWYLTGLSYARERCWLEAEASFGKIGSGSPIYGAAEEVRHILSQVSQVKRKDPMAAGFLAAIIPGAGHLYSERPRDAALAFILTGAFALATVEAFREDHEELGVMLGMITLVFYAGNIFSAVNVAHKFNDREDKRLRERLAPYEQVGIGSRQSPALGLAFKFYF